MVSWVATCVAISVLASGVLSFPGLDLHGGLEVQEDLGLHEGLGLHEAIGHEEVFDHQVGPIAQVLKDHEPHQATSYQSFHLESKNPVPVLIKDEHSFGHFSGSGSETLGHETFTHHTGGHSLKLHGF